VPACMSLSLRSPVFLAQAHSGVAFENAPVFLSPNIFLLSYGLSARMLLSLRPPPDARPLVDLQTDGGVEMPEYCFLAKPSHGTYIAGPAFSRECNVLIALWNLRGV
jgi:hypothetical protein